MKKMDNNNLSNASPNEEQPNYQEMAANENITSDIGNVENITNAETTPVVRKVSTFYKVIGILQVSLLVAAPLLWTLLFLLGNLLIGKTAYGFLLTGAFNIIFSLIFPLMGIIALINVIGLPIFIIKNKYRGRELLLPVLSVFFSIVILVTIIVLIILLSAAIDRAFQF